MHLGQVQVAAGCFQIRMAEQKLNGTQIGSCFEQMGGKAMAQRVRMDTFLEAGALGSVFDCVEDALGENCVQTLPITRDNVPSRWLAATRTRMPQIKRMAFFSALNQAAAPGSPHFKPANRGQSVYDAISLRYQSDSLRA
jgi:hypothetical protein